MQLSAHYQHIPTAVLNARINTDAHVHIGRRNGRALTEPEEIAGVFTEFTKSGITAVRDGGSVNTALAGIARRCADNTGVRFITPVSAILRRGGYGGFLGFEAETTADIKTVIDKLNSLGADFIKIIQSGIVSFDRFGEISSGGFDYPELEYIISYSHDLGLRVMTHVNGAKGVAEAVSAGSDSIEHGYFITSDTLQAMSVYGTLWVPTFVPLSNYLSAGAPPHRAAVITKTLDGHKNSLKEAVRLGVRVAVGSDAGSVFVAHGQGALDELSYFTSAGAETGDITIPDWF